MQHKHLSTWEKAKQSHSERKKARRRAQQFSRAKKCNLQLKEIALVLSRGSILFLLDVSSITTCILSARWELVHIQKQEDSVP
eukprot:g23982.t1